MNKKIKKLLLLIFNIVVEVFFWCCMAALTYFVMQIFFFSTFRIPSGSMYPELIPGDNVLVFKPTIGARVFHLFKALNIERVKVYRLPGWRKTRRNDVIIFHIPYPRSSDKIEMHLLRYYIKRCTGLPGDTLEIRNGFLHVNGWDAPLGNVESQQRVSERDSASFKPMAYHTFPFDSTLTWNIKDFGPLYIPKQGDTLTMNRKSYLLYRRLIAWEQQADVSFADSTVYMDGQPLREYCFEKNYYFMSGDWTEDSQDSRYWGLVPEEYIVGKAWVVWKSVDPQTKKWRWDRFFKRIG